MSKHVDDDPMAGKDDKAWENNDRSKFVNSCEKNGDNTVRIIMNILGHFLANKITSGIMKE